jgi:magnesium-transporting ATPase (P-type)
MWGSILTGASLTFVLSMVFLLTDFAGGMFRPDGADRYLLTGFFAFFIMTSVFNAFNARTDQMNLFDNISKNKGFLRVFALIVVVQVLMTYFGGVILRCFGLTASEWLFVIAASFLIIPVDLIRKAIYRSGNKN